MCKGLRVWDGVGFWVSALLYSSSDLLGVQWLYNAAVLKGSCDFVTTVISKLVIVRTTLLRALVSPITTLLTKSI